MKLTYPQIILLGHAASVNAERSGLTDHSKSDSVSVNVNGKNKYIEEMDSKDYTSYYSDWSS